MIVCKIDCMLFSEIWVLFAVSHQTSLMKGLATFLKKNN
jgi:hypothetical protein